MRYSAVKRCIYCGQLGSQSEPLGEEHIIPQSFGGNYTLPEASCRSCEAVTSAIENHCMLEMISTARPHLNIRGRQKSDFNRKGPVYVPKGPFISSVSVPIDKHPGALMIPALKVAGAFSSAFNRIPTSTNWYVPEARAMFRKAMTPDVAQRAWAIDKSGLNFNKQGLRLLQFYRFIAKIGHSFTVAELGNDTFSPTLINMIMGIEPINVDYFVGSELYARAASPLNHLHEIGFAKPITTRYVEAIVVRVRLFSNLGAPTHYAVSGIRFR